VVLVAGGGELEVGVVAGAGVFEWVLAGAEAAALAVVLGAAGALLVNGTTTGFDL
jgi:hypothetical protein